jgi:hypothetical protein
MTQTVTRLYDTYGDAEQAVVALERAGVPSSEISLLANNNDRSHDRRSASFADGDRAAEDAGKGATAGGVIGGVGGLLAGLGMLAVPGIGPVVAAGWLASTAVGVVAGAAVGGAAGGLVGALTRNGVSEEDAHVYAEGVRRGGVLVSVRAPDDLAGRVAEILDRHNGVDARLRGADYRSGGWSRFDDGPGASQPGAF